MMLLLQNHFEEQLNSSDDGENDGPRWIHTPLWPGEAATRQVSWDLRAGWGNSRQSLPNPLDPAQPRVFMAAFRRHSHLPPACFLVTDSPSATLQKG